MGMTAGEAGKPQRRGVDWRPLRRALQVWVAITCACLVLACASTGEAPARATAVEPAPAAGEHHTVALLGATGMVGGYLLQEALARGYTVRALARTPAKLSAFAGRITVVQGDARDPAAIERLLRGSDVVISALGPVRADGDASRFINTTATRNVLRAMQLQAISRYTVVSGAGVAMPGDDRDLLGWWIRTLAQVGLSAELEDKQAEYALLAASTADWMLVRCPLIDAQAFEHPPLVSTRTPPAFRVRAGEVARFIVDQLDTGQYLRAGPFLGSD
ncbi:MAG: NAD(P)H-binding protein [Halioglobus sp.]|nr:NAD(P)H-binding protein [Halioglobus sp.]